MVRKRGNPAILSIGEGRRTGADGRPVSHGTQAAFTSFKRDLDRRLQAEGIHQLKPKNLKPRHINLVVVQLRAEVGAGSRSMGSAKNWLAHLRTYVRLIDRPCLVPRTNAELGFGNRVYVPSESKALVLTGGRLERVTCPYVAMSLKLQREFGMRREEDMKIRPEWSDRGNKLVLRDSWCKGKRERVLLIRTASQRAVTCANGTRCNCRRSPACCCGMPWRVAARPCCRSVFRCRRTLQSQTTPHRPQRRGTTTGMRTDCRARLQVNRERDHERAAITNRFPQPWRGGLPGGRGLEWLWHCPRQGGSHER